MLRVQLHLSLAMLGLVLLLGVLVWALPAEEKAACRASDAVSLNGHCVVLLR
jgi:hypothetical protein